MPPSYGTTAKYALRKLLGSNVVSDVDAGFDALATDLDGLIVSYSQGTLAARPTSTGGSPGKQGRLYYATDIDVVFYDTGTSWVAIRGPVTVTSLPSSPFDGQEVYYVADATNGVIWHLKYRAAAPGSYKWEFVGGAPLTHEVATAETTSSTSFADLATVGPTITVPLAGDYLFTGAAKVEVSSASNNSYLAALKIGAGAIADDDAFVDFTNDNGLTAPRGSMQARTIRRNGIAAATVCKMQFRTTNGAAVPTFRRRSLAVTPIRVG